MANNMNSQNQFKLAPIVWLGLLFIASCGSGQGASEPDTSYDTAPSANGVATSTQDVALGSEAGSTELDSWAASHDAVAKITNAVLGASGNNLVAGVKDRNGEEGLRVHRIRFLGPIANDSEQLYAVELFQVIEGMLSPRGQTQVFVVNHTGDIVATIFSSMPGDLSVSNGQLVVGEYEDVGTVTLDADTLLRRRGLAASEYGLYLEEAERQGLDLGS